VDDVHSIYDAGKGSILIIDGFYSKEYYYFTVRKIREKLLIASVSVST
jgi:hypothetical protein